jgi:hypothetical protein
LPRIVPANLRGRVETRPSAAKTSGEIAPVRAIH